MRVAVVVAYEARSQLDAFAAMTMPAILEHIGADCILVAATFVDGFVDDATAYNAAVKFVSADVYLFHRLGCRLEDAAAYARPVEFVRASDDAGSGACRSVAATFSVLSSVNGFAPRRPPFARVRHRAAAAGVPLVESTDAWTELTAAPAAAAAAAAADDDGDGLWNLQANVLVSRVDEPHFSHLFLRRNAAPTCPNCTFLVTSLHHTFCCDACGLGLGHSALCSRALTNVPFLVSRCAPITRAPPSAAKRTVLLGLFGLHRNFETTAAAVHEHLIKANPNCRFTIAINTSLASTSRRDNGFGGGPIRRPALLEQQLKERLHACYGAFAGVAFVTLDDTTHFKWHPGHEATPRDKDEPVTYRIWSILEQATRDRYDVYVMLRMDVQPRRDISLDGYDDTTFRIISSEGTMNLFFHNRNWDFCWLGGRKAMRLWAYPVREFSTHAERGLHRNVTSIGADFASWRDARHTTLSAADCARILQAIGSRGNDRDGMWLEEHHKSRHVTRWRPVGPAAAGGADGRFESDAGGASWRATFRNGVFEPDRPLLGSEPVRRVSDAECVAPTWCGHGSTFRYRVDVHWRTEQYCRVIHNMNANGCSFGFRDEHNEFLWLRRDDEKNVPLEKAQ